MTDYNADLRGTPHVWPVNTLQEEERAFVSTPVLALLARFFPERTTLSLEAWHVDDGAFQITLSVTATPARVPCPLCYGETTRIHSR